MTEDLDLTVARQLGLRIDTTARDRLREAVRARMAQLGCGDERQYLARFDAAERDAVAERVSVGETYFFRNRPQLEAFVEVAAPWALARGRLRVLSAGCATGEEPYTLAIALRERGVGAGIPVEIVGIDVAAARRAVARAGRYSAWSLRATPPAIKQHYFTARSGGFELARSIREAVSFERRNLLADGELTQLAGFDVVFCRNLLMYLDDAAARMVVGRLSRALVAGGFAFVGHAETLRNLATGLRLQHTHGAFYYRAPPAEARVERQPLVEPPPPLSRVPARSPEAWRREIEASSARVRELCWREAPAAPAAPSAAPAPLAIAREAFSRERFAEALEALEALAAATPDRDARLLEAMARLHADDVDGARATCRAMLDVDDLDPDAHHALALCLQHRGDSDDAERHDEMAQYLDPAFAMPHVHRALARRRRKDPRAAAAFDRAIALLPHESAERLALFGGGFGRDALLALCRRERERLGGAR